MLAVLNRHVCGGWSLGLPGSLFVCCSCWHRVSFCQSDLFFLDTLFSCQITLSSGSFCHVMFLFNHCRKSSFIPCEILLVPNKLTPLLLKILVFFLTILLPLLVSCDSLFVGGIPAACLPSFGSSWTDHTSYYILISGVVTGLHTHLYPCSLNMWRHHSTASPEYKGWLMDTSHLKIQESMWFWLTGSFSYWG